jgi:hypothetical protein
LGQAFMWRAEPPSRKGARGAFVNAPELRRKYRGLDCPDKGAPCDWSEKSYLALKSLIEQQVPQGHERAEALERIEPLGKSPYATDKTSAAWRDLEGSSPSPEDYFRGIASQLKQIGCTANGAPYVIGGLISQLDERLKDSLVQEAAIAGTFLDEGKCPGARGLSEENKSKLRQIRDRMPNTGAGSAAR